MSDRTPKKPLSDLAMLRTEKIFGTKDNTKPYIGLEHITSGEPALIASATANSSISTNSVFYTGDVLFGKLRPNLRKSLVAPFDGYCSTDILVLQPNSGFDPGFVARVFQREEVFNEAVRTAEGTKMPRTSWGNLKDFCVFVPDNYYEQRQIARILDTLDEAIQKTEQLITKLKAIKQGMLHDLLTRGLDENGQLRDPVAHPEQFKPSPLGLIPREWEVKKLGEILDYEQPTKYIVKSTQYEEYGIPVLTAGKSFILGYTREREDIYNNFPVIIFDDFTTESKWVTFPFKVKSSAMKLLKNKEKTDLFFVYNVMQILNFKPGSEHKRFWISEYSKLVIPLPSLSEQQQCAYILLQMESMIEKEENYLSKLRLLKKGLMHDLLTGRVRVNIQTEENEHEDRHHS